MPCRINKQLSQWIANIGFVCACLVVGLHVNLSCGDLCGKSRLEVVGWWVVDHMRSVRFYGRLTLSS